MTIKLHARLHAHFTQRWQINNTTRPTREFSKPPPARGSSWYPQTFVQQPLASSPDNIVLTAHRVCGLLLLQCFRKGLPMHIGLTHALSNVLDTPPQLSSGRKYSDNNKERMFTFKIKYMPKTCVYTMQDTVFHTNSSLFRVANTHCLTHWDSSID